MRAVIQRCNSAQVTVDSEVIGKIDKGFVVFLGVRSDDTDWDLEYLARKIAGLRIFEDENGKMNLSPEAVGGEILIISNFTLYGNTVHGFRPDFITAMMPQRAEEMYLKFIELCKTYPYKKIQTGKFGADMKVDVSNDGPVNIIIETENVRKWKKKKDLLQQP